jgi:hypothetical protein
MTTGHGNSLGSMDDGYAAEERPAAGQIHPARRITRDRINSSNPKPAFRVNAAGSHRSLRGTEKCL